MERTQQRKIVEALILASAEPVPAARLADIVPGLKPKQTREIVDELNAEYESGERAFEIWEVAGGYQLRTRAGYAGWIKQLHTDRPLRLSRAALETLSVIAYKQPVTRAEIEHIRGVDAGAVLRSLLERRLVRVAGHREVPGRPMLYGTTRRFLEVFGLGRLEDLPTLREIEELAPREDGDEPEAAGAPAETAEVGESGQAEPALLPEPDDVPEPHELH